MNSNLDEGHAVNNMNKIRGAFDSIIQWVKRVFACSYDDTDSNGGFKVGTYQKHFLPRVNIENCNSENDESNFYDQPVNDPIQKYDEIRKTLTGKRADYTTGCLLDNSDCKDHS